MQFERTGFAQFITSDTGRVLRVGAGLALLGAGLRRGGRQGLATAAVGLVPLSAGAFDLCLLSPLFGGPLTGAAVRRAGVGRERIGADGKRADGAPAM